MNPAGLEGNQIILPLILNIAARNCTEGSVWWQKINLLRLRGGEFCEMKLASLFFIFPCLAEIFSSLQKPEYGKLNFFGRLHKLLNLFCKQNLWVLLLSKDIALKS